MFFEELREHYVFIHLLEFANWTRGVLFQLFVAVDSYL